MQAQVKRGDQIGTFMNFDKDYNFIFNILWLFLLVMFFIGLTLNFLTVIRLKNKHPKIWVSLGSPRFLHSKKNFSYKGDDIILVNLSLSYNILGIIYLFIFFLTIALFILFGTA